GTKLPSTRASSRSPPQTCPERSLHDCFHGPMAHVQPYPLLAHTPPPTPPPPRWPPPPAPPTPLPQLPDPHKARTTASMNPTTLRTVASYHPVSSRGSRSDGSAAAICPRLWPVPNSTPSCVRIARAIFSALCWQK